MNPTEKKIKPLHCGWITPWLVKRKTWLFSGDNGEDSYSSREDSQKSHVFIMASASGVGTSINGMGAILLLLLSLPKYSLRHLYFQIDHESPPSSVSSSFSVSGFGRGRRFITPAQSSGTEDDAPGAGAAGHPVMPPVSRGRGSLLSRPQALDPRPPVHLAGVPYPPQGFDPRPPVQSSGVPYHPQGFDPRPPVQSVGVTLPPTTPSFQPPPSVNILSFIFFLCYLLFLFAICFCFICYLLDARCIRVSLSDTAQSTFPCLLSEQGFWPGSFSAVGF